MNSAPFAVAEPELIAETMQAIRAELARIVIGQEGVIDLALIALLARGHLLLESVPGLGKTLLARALSRVLGCTMRRVQFTPDLMPGDVVGGNLYDESRREFVFVPGPIFCEILLADEINRAPAKTQSALLEAMQERSVTVDGVTRPLPSTFLTVATQNPVESQGTYPLPEAQLDRFLFKVTLSHPSRTAELAILQAHLGGFDASNLEAAGIRTLASSAQVAAMQRGVGAVKAAPEILEYLLTVIARTREHRSVELGASPRAAVALLAAGRAAAALDGRDYLTPDDVKTCALPALRHRILLQPDAEFEGVTPDDVVRGILDQVAVPRFVA